MILRIASSLIVNFTILSDYSCFVGSLKDIDCTLFFTPLLLLLLILRRVLDNLVQLVPQERDNLNAFVYSVMHFDPKGSCLTKDFRPVRLYSGSYKD
jgi:hypothetical protein